MMVADGALTQLRAWLAQRDFSENGRLPPERQLIDILGVSRGDLRKALAALETSIGMLARLFIAYPKHLTSFREIQSPPWRLQA